MAVRRYFMGEPLTQTPSSRPRFRAGGDEMATRAGTEPVHTTLSGRESTCTRCVWAELSTRHRARLGELAQGLAQGAVWFAIR